MVIIKLQGGIGNQLFQYSLYCYLKSNSNNVFLDYTDVKSDTPMNKIVLEEILILDSSDLVKVKPELILPKNRYVRKFNTLLRYFDIQLKQFSNYAYEYKKTNKNYKLFNRSFCYLSGYWQNEKYLKNILYNNLFKLNKSRIDYYTNKFSYLNQKDVLVIHVRGGDYKQLGWTLDSKYYSHAFKEFDEHEKKKIFIITDNQLYLDSMEIPFRYSVIDEFHDEASYENLFIFMCAKNLIIANSTFSWWGAFLNKNNPKIVSPSPWIKSKNDIFIPENWIKIDY